MRMSKLKLFFDVIQNKLLCDMIVDKLFNDQAEIEKGNKFHSDRDIEPHQFRSRDISMEQIGNRVHC